MKTLQQLLDDYRLEKLSDIQIIKLFFEINNLEEEGMDLIHELTKSKLGKLKDYQEVVTSWTSYLPSKYLYENYDLDTADNLHILELDYLTNGKKLSKVRLEWAKANIPNIEEPQVYFQPLVRWLDKNGIRFKKRK